MTMPADIQKLAALVREMRSAQSEYFRTRSRESLQSSKALEKRVDSELNGISSGDEDQNKQTNLFEGLA